ncbi:MAG: AAA family ATPase, partial [Nitrospirae bacterium]|nr:AAA family ATPase [Nitrospirota bacterium]
MAETDVYISKVEIHNVRHLKDIEIPLSDTERKHLIFTGINGSGKTSVLETIKEYSCCQKSCDDMIKNETSGLRIMGSRGLVPLQGVLKGGGAAPF